MNFDKLFECYAYLTERGPENFNLNRWVNVRTNDAGEPCGTLACAAGTLALSGDSRFKVPSSPYLRISQEEVETAGLRFDDARVKLLNVSRDFDGYAYAMALLDASEAVCEELFGPALWVPDRPNSVFKGSQLHLSEWRFRALSMLYIAGVISAEEFVDLIGLENFMRLPIVDSKRTWIHYRDILLTYEGTVCRPLEEITSFLVKTNRQWSKSNAT